ncbi:MAG: preprotein translocase subunit SecG [Clostridiaceae bacterium]|jgi:preprotein translocase subunit SecG|nr:preprotein translocase subunit SecG [Clostridiaceae bacterium]
MYTLTIIIAVVDVLVCIALVALVIMQEGDTGGLGTISGGGSDTFFSKSKGRTKEVMLKKLTTGVAILFAVLTVVLYLLAGRGG